MPRKKRKKIHIDKGLATGAIIGSGFGVARGDPQFGLIMGVYSAYSYKMLVTAFGKDVADYIKKKRGR